MLAGSDRYWNPIVETMPLEQLREVQLRKFRAIVSWAYDHSRLHRTLYDEAGFHPDHLRVWSDAGLVPKVDKAHMRGIQRKDPFPYGDALCVPLDRVTEFRQTSGTTGQAVYQADTWQDWEWWAECWSYLLYAQGYRARDRVFLPFGYNIFVAFWAAHYAAEKMGCEVVPGGVLDTEARILKLQELQASAMMATPTYVLGMAETARAWVSIRRATCRCVASPVRGSRARASPRPSGAWKRPGGRRCTTTAAPPRSARGASSARSSPAAST